VQLGCRGRGAGAPVAVDQDPLGTGQPLQNPRGHLGERGQHALWVAVPRDQAEFLEVAQHGVGVRVPAAVDHVQHQMRKGGLAAPSPSFASPDLSGSAAVQYASDSAEALLRPIRSKCWASQTSQPA
jgi:hypothetical protein